MLKECYNNLEYIPSVLVQCSSNVLASDMRRAGGESNYFSNLVATTLNRNSQASIQLIISPDCVDKLFINITEQNTNPNNPIFSLLYKLYRPHEDNSYIFLVDMHDIHLLVNFVNYDQFYDSGSTSTRN